MQKVGTTVFLALILLVSPCLAGEEEAKVLRQEAQRLNEQGQAGPASALLEQARQEAQAVEDPYTRANALRYVAEAFVKVNQHTKSKETFDEAMKIALTVEPWYRGLSAIIGVLELERSGGDLEGLREHGMKAIHAHVLENTAASGETGEIRRLLSALNGAITRNDAIEIMTRLQVIGVPDFSIAVLSKMKQMSYLPRKEIPKPTDFLEKLPPTTSETERKAWEDVVARIQPAKTVKLVPAKTKQSQEKVN